MVRGGERSGRQTREDARKEGARGIEDEESTVAGSAAGQVGLAGARAGYTAQQGERE